MSWVMFLLFLFCGIVWRVLVLGLLWRSDRILHWSHLVLCFFFLVGRLSMTPSISLGVMGLFRWSIWSWFNFCVWYLSRKCILCYIYLSVLIMLKGFSFLVLFICCSLGGLLCIDEPFLSVQTFYIWACWRYPCQWLGVSFIYVNN